MTSWQGHEADRQDVEHLDVLIVGAGLSGIGAARYLQRECPWASFALFEARDSIGGTWDLFRYPGVRSDSDMYTLGYSFRPWDGDDTIADGRSILGYIEDTAAETGVDAQIRFGHRVVAADWSSGDARWHVTAQRVDSGELVHVTAWFVFSCSGYYRYDRGYLPDFAGMARFAGPIVHPQHWPDDLDVTGRRIVVIGSGATAVTMIPALAETAQHVTMLQRSPSYIAAVPSNGPIVRMLRRVLPERQAGRAIRWALALTTQGFYQLSRRRPELVKKLLRKGLEQRLPAGYDIDLHFTPRYDPWDQRMCIAPDGDLFTAISTGTVSVVTDHVAGFTERGIALRSGGHLDADIVVTATGLELLCLGGITITVDGSEVDVPSRLTYKGMMLEGVPNLAFAFGYANASWTLKCDLTCGYVCRLLNHLRAGGLRQCTPHNRDADVVAAPLLGLTSGYVRRAQHRFPKQGSKSPWRVKQSYVADYRALKRQSIHDDAMVFSNPNVRIVAAPSTATAPASESIDRAVRRPVTRT
jgi:cation diffusion facilitator CzcD-associated flavoprotein CzcO